MEMNNLQDTLLPEKFDRCLDAFITNIGDEGWSEHSNGMPKIVKKSRNDGRNMNIYKVVRTYNCTIPLISELIIDCKKHNAWDPSIDSVELIENVHNCHVTKLHTASQFGVSGRFTAFITWVIDLNVDFGKQIILMSSLSTEELKTFDIEIPRGMPYGAEIEGAGFYLENMEDGVIKSTYIGSFAANGWVPDIVVSLALPKSYSLMTKSLEHAIEDELERLENLSEETITTTECNTKRRSSSSIINRESSRKSIGYYKIIGYLK